jgi:hypothetical protein
LLSIRCACCRRPPALAGHAHNGERLVNELVIEQLAHLGNDPLRPEQRILMALTKRANPSDRWS